MCKPNRPPARLRIFGNVRNDLKSYAGQQLGIIGGREARVVERVATVTSDRLAVPGAGVEHQHRGRSGVPGKDVKHISLIVVVEMEKAVPG
jgi:hypothetical protein